MRYLSVCSGIEAATVAWHPLGWKPHAFSEIDRFPSAVLAHHYPQVPNHGDMQNFRNWPDADFDVLVGGTPCQSFSVAGFRKGLSDPRGNLMLTYLAIAARYRPDWLVWENVPGVLSSNAGRDFGAFIWALGKLGYGWAYRSLDAQYFNLAQRRERVFVVASVRGWASAAAVLFERACLQGNPSPSREAREDVTGTLSARASGGGGLGTDLDLAGGLQASSGGADENDAEQGRLIARCVTAREGQRQDYETETLVTHSLRAEGFDASEDGTGRGIPIIAQTITADMYRSGGATAGNNPGVRNVIAFDETQITSSENRSNPQPGDPCHPMAASARAPTIALPLSTRVDRGGSHREAQGNNLIASGGVRRLTPEECEVLQGFPRGYTLIPLSRRQRKEVDAEMAAYYRRTQTDLTDEAIRMLAKDGPRYRAIGNSMAVPVMAWIGGRIKAVDSILNKRSAAA